MDELEAPGMLAGRADALARSPLLHPLVLATIAPSMAPARGPHESDAMLAPVPPVLVTRVAHAVKPLIEKASRYRDFSWRDIEAELIAARMQLWIAGLPGRLDMACITEIQHRPRAKVGVIVYIAGAHRERWLRFLPVIEQWMREQGCTRIEAWCRRGWERVLTMYRKTHVLMEKAL